MKAWFLTLALLFSAGASHAQSDSIYIDHEAAYKDNIQLQSIFLFAQSSAADKPMYAAMSDALKKEFGAAKIRHTAALIDESGGLDSLFAWTDRIRSSSYSVAITINKLFDASTMNNRYAQDATGKIMTVNITNNEKDDGSTIASCGIYINTKQHDAAAGKALAMLLVSFLKQHHYLP